MEPTRLCALVVPLALLAACKSAGEALDGEWVDLTYAYDEDTVYWPTAPGFRLEIQHRGPTDGGFWYEANTFTTAEHGGTHLDAPAHFAQGKQRVDEIPVKRLIGPAAVVDVRAVCSIDRDHRITVEELEDWEREHGRLPRGAIVLLRTGFGRFWPDRVRYMGTAERGEQAVAKLHFPGLHPDAARWLATEREVDAVGIDTPSIDHGQSTGFESHCILFEHQVPAFENVARLERLPPTGAHVVALPMKIRGGSGAPLRIVALLP